MNLSPQVVTLGSLALTFFGVIVVGMLVSAGLMEREYATLAIATLLGQNAGTIAGQALTKPPIPTLTSSTTVTTERTVPPPGPPTP